MTRNLLRTRVSEDLEFRLRCLHNVFPWLSEQKVERAKNEQTMATSDCVDRAIWGIQFRLYETRCSWISNPGVTLEMQSLEMKRREDSKTHRMHVNYFLRLVGSRLGDEDAHRRSTDRV